MRLPDSLTRLLYPDDRPLDAAARIVAAEHLDRAASAGILTDAAAAERRDRLGRARTRGDLRAVTGDIAGALPSPTLVAALRATSLLALAVTAIQLGVWTLISVIRARWTEPWWLWATVTLAALAGALWFSVEGHYRPRVLAPEASAS